MKKTRVLIVDDDRLVADTLQMVFRANGYESEATYSAVDGLGRARSFAPELILCDVTMPEVSGLELAQSMSEEFPECRVLMFTAYSSNAAKVEGKALQMGRPLKLLTKPCRPEDLMLAVDALLRTA